MDSVNLYALAGYRIPFGRTSGNTLYPGMYVRPRTIFTSVDCIPVLVNMVQGYRKFGIPAGFTMTPDYDQTATVTPTATTTYCVLPCSHASLFTPSLPSPHCRLDQRSSCSEGGGAGKWGHTTCLGFFLSLSHMQAGTATRRMATTTTTFFFL